MRYTNIDLQILDIMWFAIDRSGHIGAFTNGGINIVPEFVCCSKEETELLAETDYDLLSHLKTPKNFEIIPPPIYNI